MKKTILLLFVIGLLFSCTEKKSVPNPRVLIDADLAFSDYSVKHGIQKAFLEFADDSVVKLKPNSLPLVVKGDTSKGTYLSVWKKDANGRWKYVADTGNEGIR